MKKTNLIPAVLLLLSILNFANHAQQGIEEQMNEILKLKMASISLNWPGNANVSPLSNYDQKPSVHHNYANKRIVFRHLILGYFPCNRNSEQRAGGDKL